MKPGILAASGFGTGTTPTICVINQATVDLGADFKDIVDALQIQADQFALVWGTPCNLVISDKIQPGCWGLVFLDTADQAGALGYHDVTPDNLPLGKAFVKTSDQDNVLPSTVASHELLETLGDPDAGTYKMFTKNGVNYLAVLEVCDAPEATSYLITLANGKSIAVSNWVYPGYFQSFTPAGEKLDYLGLCKTPFEILPSGYLPVFNLDTGKWEQLMGAGRLSSRQRNRSERRKKAKL